MNVGVYCDGFNVYYGLKDIFRSSGQCYYWLDISGFCDALARRVPIGRPEDVAVVKKYFTADPVNTSRIDVYGTSKLDRHELYFSLIRQLGNVDVVDGRHSLKNQQCRAVCKEKYQTFEEKETDVNIGLHILRDAMLGTVDRVVLVSADTDFVPVLRMVKSECPDVETVFVSPLGQPYSRRLKKYSDVTLKLKKVDYERHMFPWSVALPDGTSVTCPLSWRHKTPLIGVGGTL